jgi:hypothetical protein
MHPFLSERIDWFVEHYDGVSSPVGYEINHLNPSYVYGIVHFDFVVIC